MNLKQQQQKNPPTFTLCLQTRFPFKYFCSVLVKGHLLFVHISFTPSLTFISSSLLSSSLHVLQLPFLQWMIIIFGMNLKSLIPQNFLCYLLQQSHFFLNMGLLQQPYLGTGTSVWTFLFLTLHDEYEQLEHNSEFCTHRTCQIY